MQDSTRSLLVTVTGRNRGEFKTTRLESMWALSTPAAKLTIALTNTSDSAVTVNASISTMGGTPPVQIVSTLNAWQGKIITLPGIPLAPHSGCGGISVTHTGAPGDVRGHAYVIDPTTGFSLNLQLNDPTTNADSSIAAAGILLGQATGADQSISFSGRPLVRNVSASPITVTPTIQRGTVSASLPVIELTAGESRVVSVPANTVPDNGEGAAIRLSNSGPKDSLVAYWYSVDASNSIVADAPFRSPAHNSPGGGNYPWSLANGNSSVLYIANKGSEAALFSLSFWFSGGQYVLGMVPIEAGEVKAFDIRRLRDEQVPDANGHTLPQDVEAGQAQWRWRAGAPLVGRLNLMNTSDGFAANMSCLPAAARRHR